jgi:hypothetical protein
MSVQCMPPAALVRVGGIDGHASEPAAWMPRRVMQAGPPPARSPSTRIARWRSFGPARRRRISTPGVIAVVLTLPEAIRDEHLYRTGGGRG